MPNRSVPDPLDVALGIAIRIRRKSIGMSQERLAEQCGVSFQQVQKYENGVNRVSFSRLVQIADALNCRVADLVDVLDRADGGDRADLDVMAHVKVAGALELLTAYEGLDAQGRASLVNFLKTLAAAQAAKMPAAR